jgi:hypothetical protein
MHWLKKGRIFAPGEHEWAGSHAQVPTVLVKNDRLRIYYADRTPENKSYTTFIDVKHSSPSEIIYFHKKSILPWGKPGTFDDDGVMPGYVMEHNGKVLMYYSGWNQRVTVPYHNSIGLAVSEDGGESFTRMFEGPIMDRAPLEPYLAVTPTILKEGNKWQMWYISGLSWEKIEEKYEPVYAIKYAYSVDGINWQRPNILCIQREHKFEAFSHPTVIKKDGKYHMWFSCRDSKDYRDGPGSYRMGYASSDDGVKWQRADKNSGIDVSGQGWDSTMICYPYLVEVNGGIYLFHNGNGFGRSGLGYAVWRE